MKSFNIICFFICLILLHMIRIPLIAQENDTITAISPNLSLVYWSNSDDTVILNANIYVRRETGLFNLENAEIAFSASDGKDIKTLGTVKAGYNGNATCKVYVKGGLLKDKEGKTTYTATFAGKGIYLEASESVTVKLAKIQVSFSKEDSVHNILIKATQIEGNNEARPIQEETVSIYVPRMLSDLKIGEITLDENGNGSVEFTGGLVGDSLGNIEIVAKIEENEDFGNVKGKSTISWGIPKQYFLAERPARELWTPIAPVWMIITLIIMLVGVWGHYIYAVFQLIMIKKHGKQKKEYL